MKTILIILTYFLFSSISYSSETDSELTQVGIQKLNADYESADNYNKLLQENYELKKILLEIDYFNKQQSSIKEDIAELKIYTRQLIDSNKNAINDKLNLYVTFAFILFSLIGFAVTFFGKRAIKERVEQIIQNSSIDYAEKKTIEVLEQKITNDFVANIIKDRGELEVIKLLASLEEKGHKVITYIEKHGQQAIDSFTAKLPDNEEELTGDSSDVDDDKGKQNRRVVSNLFNLARTVQKEGELVKIYESILELDKENVIALNNLGVSLNNLGKYEQAVSILDRAININDKFALAYANKANSLNNLNRFDDALIEVDYAIKLDPSLEISYTVKGTTLTKLKKYKEAEKVLSKGIELNPLSAEAYYGRGFLNEDWGRYKESLSDYIKAEELGYKKIEALYNNYAVLYRRLEDFEKALEYVDKAIEINPEYPNLFGTKALIYSDLGIEDKFYKFLKVALDKGCPVWNYLDDKAFDEYRNTKSLNNLLSQYKENYVHPRP